ncbi:hypothetical protein PWG14_28375 [Chromobacterium amazonense]|uniref:hypothetical protein n=1 Tax=Chromobacterium amazonense TaxID=1382803 RepID=UPI00237E27F0|nr:hypothetical protein [Chromobacterium amazonense]MDE1716389.1 hypothetical protein [Chromobacterium amazonense]
MSFTVTHRYGCMDRDPPISDLPRLLDELLDRPEDVEHGAVAVTHESEWSISVARGGYVLFEHLENGGERHMLEVQDEDILRMWQLLAAGEIAELELFPWKPGYE